ncbi:MAG: hypothetical protein EXS15_08540 [Phycisphaerales bacterium]|nr:hypothetical protein [Phycisphaerales bacterium]
MTQQETPQFPGSRRAAKILFAAFILTAAIAFIWGFIVVEKVRERAKETDGALRSIAWSCLCYAQQGDREWPDSEESLIASESSWDCDHLAGTGTDWPATRALALDAMVSPANAADALKIAAIEFPKSAGEFPRVTARGNPSGLDTLRIVNDWLAKYQAIRVNKP